MSLRDTVKAAFAANCMGDADVATSEPAEHLFDCADVSVGYARSCSTEDYCLWYLCCHCCGIGGSRADYVWSALEAALRSCDARLFVRPCAGLSKAVSEAVRAHAVYPVEARARCVAGGLVAA